MHYKFPIIERIEDVLPAIQDRDEFVVAERDRYTVINYNVGYADTFDIDENDLMENHGEMIPKGIMRRECRGLIFDVNGDIMSRPFHKFFNVSEREETQLHNLDMSKPHVIMEKMDGSMVRPLYLDGRIQLATKMGVTDVAEEALEYLLSRSDAAEITVWMQRMIAAGITPLFEYVSPKNQIVIEYEEPDLVLLALRNNRNGLYIPFPEYREDSITSIPRGITQVPEYGSVDGGLEEYVARQRESEGREGDIIRFADGHAVKVKNDWYVRIHKVKDKIRTDRHILALLLENELDDVYPHLDERDYERVKQYERDFHRLYHEKLVELDQVVNDLITDAEGDRKRLATEVLPASDLDQRQWRFVFAHADGKDLNDLLMEHVRKNLGNTRKYLELAEFLGLPQINDDQGELE